MFGVTWVEIDLAVVFLGMTAYIAAVALKCKPRYVIPSVAVFTLLASTLMFVRDAETLSYDRLGLGGNHFTAALLWLAPVTVICGLLMMLYGYWTRKALWSRRLLLVLPIYLLWGLVQQSIFQGILNRRLQELTDSPWVVIPLVGLLFSAVHAPRWWLVGLTAVIGPVWAYVYYVTPNLFALALSHALLGVLAYFFVVGEDPLAEV